jgi:hypothetical protein
MNVFRDVALYSLVEIYRRFRGAYYLHHQVRRAACSSPWWWRSKHLRYVCQFLHRHMEQHLRRQSVTFSLYFLCILFFVFADRRREHYNCCWWGESVSFNCRHQRAFCSYNRWYISRLLRDMVEWYWQGKNRRTRRKNPSAILSSINSIWTDPDTNPVIRG